VKCAQSVHLNHDSTVFGCPTFPEKVGVLICLAGKKEGEPFMTRPREL
jgi:hypothetical protein